MCGIYGDSKIANVKAMMKSSRFRGPDASSTLEHKHIALGHNLLNIMDSVENSLQPFKYNDSILLYNGEAYNYAMLRYDDVQYKSNTDTEVIAVGLDREGVQFLSKIDGMYAVAHIKDNILLLARDTHGAKPLYYKLNPSISFSSNLASLNKLYPDGISKQAQYLYENFGYVFGGQSYVDNILKLWPGQFIRYDLEKKVVIESGAIIDRSTNGPELTSLKALIERAVEQSTMGTRKIGLFLSGGLDSSIILYHLRKLELRDVLTFTTRFTECDEKYNQDADIAKYYSKRLKFQHHELLVGKQELLDSIEESMLALDSANNNKSIPVYFLLHKYAKKLGITVILTGDGGDEIFCGYKHHLNMNPFLTCYNSFNYRMGLNKSHTIDTKVFKWIPPEIKSILNSNDATNNYMALERITNLSDSFLIRNDNIGMYHSLESRFPLLSNSIIEYGNKIPGHLKVGKRTLRGIYNSCLPSAIINKPKSGWSIPIDDWIQDNEFKNKMLKLADKKTLPPNPTGKQIFSNVYLNIWLKQRPQIRVN